MPASSQQRCLTAVVVLQSLTLVAVLAGRPADTPAAAFDLDGNRGRNAPTLPNAAAQRQEMIRILQANVEASQASGEASNKTLQSIDRRVEGLVAAVERLEERLPEPQQQPQQQNGQPVSVRRLR